MNYCLIDGSENLHQLIVWKIYHYLQGFIHVGWLFGISEPSTVELNNSLLVVFISIRSIQIGNLALRTHATRLEGCCFFWVGREIRDHDNNQTGEVRE